ncbi:hypothetical protein ACV356_32890, partial [Pseudomonas aeruginosa]
EIRKQYERDQQTMTGHDYHRVYASLLIKWTTDSTRRRSKISDHNRAGQKKAREGYHRDVQTQLDQHAIAPVARTVMSVDSDDD